MKTKVTYLTICLVIGLLSVLVLTIVTEPEKVTNKDFIRIFHAHPFVALKQIDLSYNSYYFAGSGKQTIYLGNFSTPYHLLAVDKNLEHSDKVNLVIEQPGPFSRNAANIKIDSPDIYLIDPLPQKAWQGTIGHASVIPIKQVFTDRFSLVLPISRSTLIYRTFDTPGQSSTLKKVSLVDNVVSHQSIALERQIDGMFCTDGTLTYDKSRNQLVYLYYYRNEFICFDTTLTMIRKSHTIDPISQARLTVDQHTSGTSKTLSLASPPLQINKGTSLSGGRLFVHAARRAHNEEESVFEKYSVIDVYTVKDGRYHFSLYIPDINDKKIRDFEVIDSILYILQDQHMRAYTLNL